MGIIFVTHGAARLINWTVPEFGGFLESKGFPLGIVFALIVTLGEVIFGSLMAIGLKVRYCVIFHGIVIVMGIFLVHLPRGWFTVGPGSGGVEYSILILAVLLLIYGRTGKSHAGVYD